MNILNAGTNTDFNDGFCSVSSTYNRTNQGIPTVKFWLVKEGGTGKKKTTTWITCDHESCNVRCEVSFYDPIWR